MAKKAKLLVDMATSYFLMEKYFLLLSEVHGNIIISLLCNTKLISISPYSLFLFYPVIEINQISHIYSTFVNFQAWLLLDEVTDIISLLNIAVSAEK